MGYKNSEPMTPHVYLGFKLLHVVAVILFLGNIVSGLFWKAHADRSRSPAIIHNAIEGIISSDRLFTIPAIYLIVIGGVGAAIAGRYPILGTGWIFWSIVLFSVSGFAFGSQVAPLQRKLRAVALAGAETGQLDWATYGALSRRWELWGIVALAAPAIATALMILKPLLPSLRDLL